MTKQITYTVDEMSLTPEMTFAIIETHVRTCRYRREDVAMDAGIFGQPISHAYEAAARYHPILLAAHIRRLRRHTRATQLLAVAEAAQASAAIDLLLSEVNSEN